MDMPEALKLFWRHGFLFFIDYVTLPYVKPVLKGCLPEAPDFNPRSDNEFQFYIVSFRRILLVCLTILL